MNFTQLSYEFHTVKLLSRYSTVLVFISSVISITAKDMSRIQNNFFFKYGFGHNNLKYFFEITCKTNEENMVLEFHRLRTMQNVY